MKKVYETEMTEPMNSVVSRFLFEAILSNTNGSKTEWFFFSYIQCPKQLISNKINSFVDRNHFYNDKPDEGLLLPGAAIDMSQRLFQYNAFYEPQFNVGKVRLKITFPQPHAGLFG